LPDRLKDASTAVAAGPMSLISNIMLSYVRLAYETLALPVFHRHRGQFERILKPSPVAGAQPDLEVPPDEIHLLRFETPHGLEAVRRDPEMVALVPLREQIVRKALLLRVDDVPLEGYFNRG
jgi:hypothetical protein